MADAEWLYFWKMTKLARFEPAVAPDISFTYFTCSECEPEEILSAFHYDPAKKPWMMRKWPSEPDIWWATPAGLVISEDISADASTVAFSCLYKLPDLNNDGFDDLAIRCRQVDEPSKGKRIVNDSTVLYSFRDGQFSSAILKNLEERKKSCRNSAK